MRGPTYVPTRVVTATVWCVTFVRYRLVSINYRSKKKKLSVNPPRVEAATGDVPMAAPNSFECAICRFLGHAGPCPLCRATRIDTAQSASDLGLARGTVLQAFEPQTGGGYEVDEAFAPSLALPIATPPTASSCSSPPSASPAFDASSSDPTATLPPPSWGALVRPLVGLPILVVRHHCSAPPRWHVSLWGSLHHLSFHLSFHLQSGLGTRMTGAWEPLSRAYVYVHQLTNPQDVLLPNNVPARHAGHEQLLGVGWVAVTDLNSLLAVCIPTAISFTALRAACRSVGADRFGNAKNRKRGSVGQVRDAECTFNFASPRWVVGGSSVKYLEGSWLPPESGEAFETSNKGK